MQTLAALLGWTSMAALGIAIGIFAFGTWGGLLALALYAIAWLLDQKPPAPRKNPRGRHTEGAAQSDAFEGPVSFDIPESVNHERLER